MTCITCGMMMTHLKADLFICEKCGLVSSDVPPDPSIYDKSYDIKYQRYARTEENSLLQTVRMNTVLDNVMDEGGCRDDFYTKILDFGCGVGRFVDSIHKLGIEIKGFDINPYGKFCDVMALLNGFNVVTFWDSLEHVQDPKRLIEGLKAKYVFVSTPSIDDFDGDLTEFHHYYPGEHVHYFNELSLTHLFSTCGYYYIPVVVGYDESKIRKSGGDKNILTMGFKHGGN